jgi:heat shock protein HspQ
MAFLFAAVKGVVADVDPRVTSREPRFWMELANNL